MVTKDTRLAITVPTTAAAVARLQREAEAEEPIYSALAVASDDDYAVADTILTDVVTRLDAIVAMKKSATAPLQQSLDVIRGWFRPTEQALIRVRDHVKGVMGGYRVAKLETERAARELAAVAAETGAPPEALVEALETANAAAEKPDARASCGFRWIVKRIVAEMLPDEWWIRVPDATRIAAVADDAPGDGDAPIVPGVVFERVARIGAKR